MASRIGGKLDKEKLLNVIMRIAQIINDTCETDKEVEQVKESVEKYIDFFKSIPQA